MPMFVGRARRRLLAAFVTLALLFTQWAVASYACPQLTAAAAAPCEGHAVAKMDPERGVLCKSHCTAGAQQPAADLLPLPAAVPADARIARVLDLAGAEGIAAAIPASVAVGPPDGSPPIYLSLLVLRH